MQNEFKPLNLLREHNCVSITLTASVDDTLKLFNEHYGTIRTKEEVRQLLKDLKIKFDGTEKTEPPKRLIIPQELRDVAAKLGTVKDGTYSYDDILAKTVILGTSGVVWNDGSDIYLTVYATTKRQYNIYKSKLRFMKVVTEHHSDGTFLLDRNPSQEEASVIRQVVGLWKGRELSDSTKENRRKNVSKAREKKDTRLFPQKSSENDLVSV